MGELLEAGGGVVGVILLVAFLLWVMHLAFGSQAFGLPAMVGVLLIAALGSALPSLGILTILAIAGGLVVLFAVIGMAMSLGPERLPKAHDEKPGEGGPRDDEAPPPPG